MCSGRSGPSYAAWSTVRASFSSARPRGLRSWAPAGRLPPVGLPPEGPRPPDLPRVSPDRPVPPRESPRESLRGSLRDPPRDPPRESPCDPPRDDELPRPLPDEPPRPPPDPPRDGCCPRRSSATAALPFSTRRHPVRGQRYSYRARNGAGATRSLVAPAKCLSGGVLLSHNLSVAVPSALKGLTSGFGMGPGVSRFAMAAVTLSTSSNPHVLWDGFVGWELLSGREQVCVFVGLRGRTWSLAWCACVVLYGVGTSPRPISTGRLGITAVHLRPINPMFCGGPYPIIGWETSS